MDENTDNKSNTAVISDTRTEISLGKPYNVILFNDDHHDMVEVMAQIIKAISCSVNAAKDIMMEAHLKGRAVVITTNLERCELVASILEEIRLGTKIEPA